MDVDIRNIMAGSFRLYAIDTIALSLSQTSMQPPKKAGKKKGASGKKKGGTGKKKGKSGKKKGKSKGKKKGAAEKKAQPVADPMSYDAMLNAYYIAHGPVQFLEFRGYNWTGGAKKKKKAGGKKKKR